MGCGGSKTPEGFLVTQSVAPDHVLIQGAISANIHTELHSRIAKDTGLTTMLAASGKARVKIYEKPEGAGIFMQSAQDLSIGGGRAPHTTFFDDAGKPAAVLVGNAKKTSNDLRPVLYARDVPSQSTSGTISDLVAGQVFRKVDATKTMEDGTVLHAYGIIRRMYTGDGAPLGLFRVDPEGAHFKTTVPEMGFSGLGNILDIVNEKKEPIAYINGYGSQGKIFVAAGVDAVLAVALFTACEMNDRLSTTNWSAGAQ